jgi:hypothetical protein
MFSPYFALAMRKCLAIMFLVIFSLQVLPLKVIGKLLCKGQNTEEVQEDEAGEDGDARLAKYNDDHTLPPTTDLTATMLAFGEKVTAIFLKADALPSVHVAELLSPPPDC